MVILFHVAPQATWSNLPISGTFVEMLRRIVQLSRQQGAAAVDPQTTTVAHCRPIAHDRRGWRPAASRPEAKPEEQRGRGTVENPPGLYGRRMACLPHNLLPADAVFTPLVQPAIRFQS